MTGITNQATGVVFRVHLRKPFRLGTGRLMALAAQCGWIGLHRHNGKVGSMLTLRSMARLAIHARVFSFDLGVGDIGVAGFTCLMTRVHHRQCSDLSDRVAAVMAILPEAARNEQRPQAKEDEQSCYEKDCDPNQMLCVLHRASERNSRPIKKHQ